MTNAEIVAWAISGKTIFALFFLFIFDFVVVHGLDSRHIHTVFLAADNTIPIRIAFAYYTLISLSYLISSIWFFFPLCAERWILIKKKKEEKSKTKLANQIKSIDNTQRSAQWCKAQTPHSREIVRQKKNRYQITFIHSLSKYNILFAFSVSAQGAQNDSLVDYKYSVLLVLQIHGHLNFFPDFTCSFAGWATGIRFVFVCSDIAGDAECLNHWKFNFTLRLPFWAPYACSSYSSWPEYVALYRNWNGWIVSGSKSSTNM